MKKPVLSLLFLMVMCSWVFVSCMTGVKEETPKKEPVTKSGAVVDEMHKSIKLNIHVRHFNNKSIQGVSPWVYSHLIDAEKNKYERRNDFVRYHEFPQIKSGICDNTVRMTDKETGKIIFMCGAHTSTKR
jgi:hypothetical protein